MFLILQKEKNEEERKMDILEPPFPVSGNRSLSAEHSYCVCQAIFQYLQETACIYILNSYLSLSHKE